MRRSAGTERIRLSGYDTWFVVDEPVEPQHTLKIAIFDEATSKAFDEEQVAGALANASTVLPQMRWRLRAIPGGINRPLWMVDEGFDVRNHLKFIHLEAPGTKAVLCRTIGDIASKPIPTAMPPWELWFLEGFTGTKVVAVLKVSHALADGGTCAKLIEMLTSPDPNAPPVPAVVPRPVVATTWSRLIRESRRELGREMREEIPRLLNVMRDARRAGRKPTSIVSPPSVLRAPRLPWRGRLTHERTFGFVSIPLADVKALGREIEGTVNDVVLAIVAGAVRECLLDEGLPFDRPVVATTVAKNRRQSDRRLWGNAVTTRIVGLPTHLDGPLDRLRFAHEQTVSMKARVAHRDGAQLEEWIDLVPPIVMRPASKLIRWAFRRSSGYVMISNVVGPQSKRYVGGMGVENFISSGHLKYAAGINVTVWSYDGMMNFAVYGCAATLPDADRFADRLQSAFDELHAAVNPGEAPLQLKPQNAARL